MAAGRKTTYIQGVETAIGFNFSDPNIFWEALHVPGALVRDIGNRMVPTGNKRLAIVGDAFIKAAIVHAWYRIQAATGTQLMPLSRIKLMPAFRDWKQRHCLCGKQQQPCEYCSCPWLEQFHCPSSRSIRCVRELHAG